MEDEPIKVKALCGCTKYIHSIYYLEKARKMRCPKCAAYYRVYKKERTKDSVLIRDTLVEVVKKCGHKGTAFAYASAVKQAKKHDCWDCFSKKRKLILSSAKKNYKPTAH